MYRTLIAALLAGVVGLSSPLQAESFRFVAMGDLPYGASAEDGRFERLIDEVNRREPTFSVHVGDIKTGSSPCTDERFQLVLDGFQRLDAPLHFTPGDNEWTDCHRKKAGQMDPQERLQRLRQMFFGQPGSLGRKPMATIRQSDTGPHKQMVENAIWVTKDVLFATIHIVGSNNNLGREKASDREYESRDAANLDWLRTAFAEARTLKAKALVLIFHAELHFDKEKAWESSKSGFRNTLRLLSEQAEAFGKPILLVHGDSHELVIDKPLKGDLGKGWPLSNVTRLEVMGGWDVGGVEVRVDPGTNAVFSFTPFTITNDYAPSTAR